MNAEELVQDCQEDQQQVAGRIKRRCAGDDDDSLHAIEAIDEIDCNGTRKRVKPSPEEIIQSSISPRSSPLTLAALHIVAQHWLIEPRLSWEIAILEQRIPNLQENIVINHLRYYRTTLPEGEFIEEDDLENLKASILEEITTTSMPVHFDHAQQLYRELSTRIINLPDHFRNPEQPPTIPQAKAGMKSIVHNVFDTYWLPISLILQYQSIMMTKHLRESYHSLHQTIKQWLIDAFPLNKESMVVYKLLALQKYELILNTVEAAVLSFSLIPLQYENEYNRIVSTTCQTIMNHPTFDQTIDPLDPSNQRNVFDMIRMATETIIRECLGRLRRYLQPDTKGLLTDTLNVFTNVINFLYPVTIDIEQSDNLSIIMKGFYSYLKDLTKQLLFAKSSKGLYIRCIHEEFRPDEYIDDDETRRFSMYSDQALEEYTILLQQSILSEIYQIVRYDCKRDDGNANALLTHIDSNNQDPSDNTDNEDNRKQQEKKAELKLPRNLGLHILLLKAKRQRMLALPSQASDECSTVVNELIANGFRYAYRASMIRKELCNISETPKQATEVLLLDELATIAEFAGMSALKMIDQLKCQPSFDDARTALQYEWYQITGKIFQWKIDFLHDAKQRKQSNQILYDPSLLWNDVIWSEHHLCIRDKYLSCLQNVMKTMNRFLIKQDIPIDKLDLAMKVIKHIIACYEDTIHVYETHCRKGVVFSTTAWMRIVMIEIDKHVFHEVINDLLPPIDILKVHSSYANWKIFMENHSHDSYKNKINFIYQWIQFYMSLQYLKCTKGITCQRHPSDSNYIDQCIKMLEGLPLEDIINIFLNIHETVKDENVLIDRIERPLKDLSINMALREMHLSVNYIVFISETILFRGYTKVRGTFAKVTHGKSWNWILSVANDVHTIFQNAIIAIKSDKNHEEQSDDVPICLEMPDWPKSQYLKTLNGIVTNGQEKFHAWQNKMNAVSQKGKVADRSELLSMIFK